MQLQGKKILLAVTGSIAAYKTPDLVRQFIKAGAEVRVIMTPSAADFVSPLALSTVAKSPVHSNVADGAAWNNHVELGRWADAMIVAPCSANTLAKMAQALCDNLVCAVYLSAICPVFIAPAMDEDMWLHPGTKYNLQRLREYGNHIIPVGHGELASGLVGEGRMAEPHEIVQHLIQHFNQNTRLPLRGQKALVTAGPTYELIDPVRFIGNFSTGKMGIAIAESLAKQGAQVTLILGPTHLRAVHERIDTVLVQSAQEMWNAATQVFPECSIAVLAAAVADYRPETIAANKIKKAGDTLELTLTKTPDTLATLGSRKKEGQIVVGFALETNDEAAHAAQKLEAKNADMIVLNSLKDAGAGFGHDTNKLTLLDRAGNVTPLELQSKKDAAEAIVNRILKFQSQYEHQTA